MLYIDGSYGEGGGQILRSSLSLAAITGRSIRIERIRAKREKPGLAIQHLTGVRAAAAICQAEVKGDTLGSTTLEFTPSRPVQPGEYTFDVAQTVGTGEDVGVDAIDTGLKGDGFPVPTSLPFIVRSAGAVTLILQTVLLPLALTSSESVVILKGGTFVPWSPPAPYIEQVYLPILQRMGVQAEVKTRSWGWYPRGGGELELRVTGNGGGVASLGSLQLLERGALQQVKGLAVVTELPSHIPQRMASRAQNLLEQAHLKAQVQPLRERGVGPGAGIFLTAEYEYSRAGFGTVGKVGLASEQVAAITTQELLNFHTNGAPVDVHLADQLLLPVALASKPSQYRVAEVSTHLITNAWVIEQFALAKIAIDAANKYISVTPAC